MQKRAYRFPVSDKAHSMYVVLSKEPSKRADALSKLIKESIKTDEEECAWIAKHAQQQKSYKFVTVRGSAYTQLRNYCAQNKAYITRVLSAILELQLSKKCANKKV